MIFLGRCDYFLFALILFLMFVLCGLPNVEIYGVLLGYYEKFYKIHLRVLYIEFKEAFGSLNGKEMLNTSTFWVHHQNDRQLWRALVMWWNKAIHYPLRCLIWSGSSHSNVK